MFWLQMIVMVLYVIDVFGTALLANEERERMPYNAFNVVGVVVAFIIFWLCGGFSTFFPSPLAP